MTNAVAFLNNLGIEVPKDLEDQVNENLKVKGGKKKENVRFVLNQEFDWTGTKLPNQAKFLLKALEDVEEPVDYDEWGTLATEVGMGTKQDPARIAAYYRKQLEDMGAISRA